ncbi:hypothetical protein DL764_001727 [Monosporascus ibericus]|uniref:Uncharacterized protein n=1 Tax=Monosporascus ibericus TaxID=155417 RepID=A0A4Q4TRP9_9PEZI|nr:hypothetical protein DL764_001727 [Monosporascus ibericus]
MYPRRSRDRKKVRAEGQVHGARRENRRFGAAYANRRSAGGSGQYKADDGLRRLRQRARLRISLFWAAA